MYERECLSNCRILAKGGRNIPGKAFIAALLLLKLGALLTTTTLAATDDQKTIGKDLAPFEDLSVQLSFSSPLEAYRQGKAAFDEGWYSLALPALKFAAKRGVFGARLKLAKMYELGLGVSKDPAAAFELYRNISEKHWNISNFHPAAPFIGQALNSLGLYYLEGIDEIGLKPDARRAATYFTHAAQFFGNPSAQYQLAKLYLSGQGVKKNVRRAIAWLNNATKKKHAPSQALLGQLLWEGEIVPKRQITALALLTMARENAAPEDSEWINGIYRTIVAASDLKTRKGARTAVARWIKVFSPKNRTKRVIIRKEVRIGIAENGDAIVESKQTIKRPASVGREPRQWMGMGGFREIDAK